MIPTAWVREYSIHPASRRTDLTIPSFASGTFFRERSRPANSPARPWRTAWTLPDSLPGPGASKPQRFNPLWPGFAPLNWSVRYSVLRFAFFALLLASAAAFAQNSAPKPPSSNPTGRPPRPSLTLARRPPRRRARPLRRRLRGRRRRTAWTMPQPLPPRRRGRSQSFEPISRSACCWPAKANLTMPARNWPRPPARPRRRRARHEGSRLARPGPN
jgi:hypothetical protein